MCSHEVFNSCQRNTFSSLCASLFSFKLYLFKYSDSETSQRNAYLLVCVCMCLFKVEFLENVDPQTLQLWFLSSMGLHVFLQTIIHSKG